MNASAPGFVMLQLEIWISYIAGPNFRFLSIMMVMREECAWELDGACLKWGGFHLVVTEVVPVGGSVDEKVEFISMKLTPG